MTQIEIGGRMPEQLVGLVETVTSHLGDAAHILSRQVRLARVVSYSATNVDVTTPPGTPRVALPNGPTPGRALIYANGEIVSEVMVWIRDGRFIGLEQPWYTDNPPTTWPRSEQVQAEQ